MTSICRTWWSSSITTCWPVSRASQYAINLISSLLMYCIDWSLIESERLAVHLTNAGNGVLRVRLARPLALNGVAAGSTGSTEDAAGLSGRLLAARRAPRAHRHCRAAWRLLGSPPRVTARTRVPGARALSADSSIAYHSTRFPRAALRGAAPYGSLFNTSISTSDARTQTHTRTSWVPLWVVQQLRRLELTFENYRMYAVILFISSKVNLFYTMYIIHEVIWAWPIMAKLFSLVLNMLSLNYRYTWISLLNLPLHFCIHNVN